MTSKMKTVSRRIGDRTAEFYPNNKVQNVLRQLNKDWVNMLNKKKQPRGCFCVGYEQVIVLLTVAHFLIEL